jgi:hypothetical protein
MFANMMAMLTGWTLDGESRVTSATQQCEVRQEHRLSRGLACIVPITCRLHASDPFSG